MSRMTGASGGPDLLVLDGDAVGLDRSHFLPSFVGRGAAVKRARDAAPTAAVHHPADRAHERCGAGAARRSDRARLARPGTQIVSPLRHAAQPSSATSFGDMIIIAGTAFAELETRAPSPCR